MAAAVFIGVLFVVCLVADTRDVVHHAEGAVAELLVAEGVALAARADGNRHSQGGEKALSFASSSGSSYRHNLFMHY